MSDKQRGSADRAAARREKAAERQEMNEQGPSWRESAAASETEWLKGGRGEQPAFEEVKFEVSDPSAVQSTSTRAGARAPDSTAEASRARSQIDAQSSDKKSGLDSSRLIGHASAVTELWDPITLGVIAASPTWAASELGGDLVDIGQDGAPVRRTLASEASRIIRHLNVEFNSAVSTTGDSAVAGDASSAKRMSSLFGSFTSERIASTADELSRLRPKGLAAAPPFEYIMRRPGAYAIFARAAKGKTTFASAAANYISQFKGDAAPTLAYKMISEPEPFGCFFTPGHSPGAGSVPFIPAQPLTLSNLNSGLSSAMSRVISGVGLSKQLPDDLRVKGDGQSLLHLDAGRPVRHVVILDSIKDFMTLPGFSSALGSGGFPLQILRMISMWNTICQMTGVTLLVVANPINLKEENAEAFESALLGACMGLFTLDGVSEDGDLFGPEGKFIARKFNNRREVHFRIRGSMWQSALGGALEAYVPNWASSTFNADDTGTSISLKSFDNRW